jgi:hypothetical protein
LSIVESGADAWHECHNAPGWVALFGMSISACRPLPGGETCGDRMISGGGLLVALACLGAALAIAVIGAGVLGRRRLSC